MIIEKRKLVDYLLSPKHPTGGSKAQFFARFGFRADDWEILRDALAKHIRHNLVMHSEQVSFGIKYVVEGALETPDGRYPRIRTVWFVRSGEHRLQLVTAYPLKGQLG